MAYQSLYRRYRPQRFSELRGQEHLVRALQHAVTTNTVGHAYLFSGPRGTGKTSTARILAKVLNCENPIDGEPCGVCDSCVAVEHGSSFDVHELDAASNNGVEAIRELITKTAMGTPGRTKVYILDEVHMLSTAASNALLKTLEEPPPHVVFVLATTDPQKVLPTIRSRTQHFDVRLLSADELTALADFIIADAELEVPEGAVDYVVRVGAGSARDMESALDQVVAAGGIPDDSEAVDELVEALCSRDTGRALLAVEAASARGRTPRLLGEMCISRLRDVFLAAMGADLARLPDRDRERVIDQAARLGAAGATRALDVMGEAFVGIQDAPDQRIPLEVALVRLTRPELDTSLAALAERITRLEQRGPVGSPPASSSDRGTESIADSPGTDESDESSDGVPLTAATHGGRPAASAREVLEAKKQARGAGTSRATATRAPTEKSAAPSQEPYSPPESTVDAAASDESVGVEPAINEPTSPEPTSPEVREAQTVVGDQPVSADGVPSIGEVTEAWENSILASLSPRSKAFFSGGRFVAVTDRAAVFGLPNATHMQKCESGRADVEAALSTYFEWRLPLQLVVDDDSTTATPRAAQIGQPNVVASVETLETLETLETVERHDERDEIDPSDLVDATDAGTTSVDRVRELFPGAELIEPT